jgi:hypothetical protein
MWIYINTDTEAHTHTHTQRERQRQRQRQRQRHRERHSERQRVWEHIAQHPNRKKKKKEQLTTVVRLPWFFRKALFSVSTTKNIITFPTVFFQMSPTCSHTFPMRVRTTEFAFILETIRLWLIDWEVHRLKCVLFLKVLLLLWPLCLKLVLQWFINLYQNRKKKKTHRSKTGEIRYNRTEFFYTIISVTS